MLNYTVYCKTAKRFIVPWNIVAVMPPDATFRDFFSTNVARRIHEPSRELNAVYVGPSKEKMDYVDSDLKVNDVTSTFGPFAKFVVEEIGVEDAIETLTGIKMPNTGITFLSKTCHAFLQNLLAWEAGLFDCKRRNMLRNGKACNNFKEI